MYVILESVHERILMVIYMWSELWVIPKCIYIYMWVDVCAIDVNNMIWKYVSEVRATDMNEMWYLNLYDAINVNSVWYLNLHDEK